MPRNGKPLLERSGGRAAVAFVSIIFTILFGIAYYVFSPNLWPGHYVVKALPLIDLAGLWTGAVIVWFFPMYDFVDKELRNAIERRSMYKACGGKDLDGDGYKAQEGIISFFRNPVQRLLVRYSGGVVGITPGVGLILIASGHPTIGAFLFVYVFALAVFVTLFEASWFVLEFSRHAPGQQFLEDLLKNSPPP
ncbi:MAG: hypothetical protein JRN35_09730 [Nitrososphaerota archaeon]|jgi:hypothetical protein|nr:hypothetical protein [Nitrososphaerota archaeon]